MSGILFLGAPVSPHAARWIRFLRARGHDVHVGTIHEIPSWAADISTPLRTGGDVSRPGAIGDLREAVPRLRALVRERRPEATLAYYATSYGLMAALARVPNVTIATAGGDVLVDPFDSRLHRLRNRAILALSLRHARTVLAWSPHVSQRLRALGVPERKIFEQVRGIDVERFSRRRGGADPAADADADRDASDDARAGAADAVSPGRILSNRLFKPLYDVPTLVRALGRLTGDGVPLEAMLFGDGVERARLEALVRELDLGDVVSMPGLVDEDAMIDALARADVYVSTSTTDGASSSLFEALAMGVYPVVSDIPANRAWIEDGRNGRLFPVGDDAALARALADVLARPAERDRAARHNVALAREHLDLRKNLVRIEERMLHGT
jgi:glycosyltransferase involved in cell wall biosynthesis